MKKITWLFMSLMLLLGMGTASAQPSAPVIVSPANGSAVAPGQTINFVKNSDYTTGMAGTGLIYTIDDAASLDVTNENDIQGIMQMSYFGSDVNGVYGCFMSDVAYAAYDPEDPTVEIANWMPTPTIPSDAAGAFTLRVRAVDMSTWALSDIVTANYTAGDATPVPVPTLTPAAGSKVLKGGKVTVVKPNPDDGFYYDVLYVLDNAGFDFTKYKCYDDDICADGPAVPTGQMYRNPITITKNTTVKVITVKYNNFSGKILGWSEPVTASYIAVDAPAAPTFNPDGGEVEDGTAILLTNGTESDATPMPIYYNYKTAKDLTDIKTTADLDQANRQMASLSNAKLYTSAGIQIKKDQTINAATADIDANGNVIWSAVTTKSFTYKEPEVVKPEAPVFTPDGGTVAPGQKITLTQADGEDIYYCLNGGESNFEMWEYAEDLVTAEQAGSLTLYSASEGITLTENATVWAAAVQFNNDEDETITWSDIISKEFTVEGEPVVTVAIPVITPGNDAIVHMGDLVTIICETEGAEIYYSVGNDKPYTTDKDGYPVAVKEGALKYTEPFALTEDMLIKQGKVYALKINAVAAMGDAISENGAAAGYVVYPNAPEFSPAAGEVEEGTKVTITCIPSQTKIYYTLDGSTPAEETATEYTEPIEITEAMTVKVVAVLGQYQTTGSAAYTIKGETPVTTPVELTFDPASGSEVEEGTAVTITANQEVELFYMMFASEEAAKAAEWDQEKAESYNEEMKPVVSKEQNTLKVAYALSADAESVEETFFYATYTIKGDDPVIDPEEISLTFNPASGAAVEEGTAVTITANAHVEIFYMMFESEAAAKAAEWDQEKAESYNEEMKPVVSKETNTLKVAYAKEGAEAIEDTFFYATYTVNEKPAITLTFNPASGSKVKAHTTVTVTASRETEIFYNLYVDSAAAAADTLFMVNAKAVSEDGMPVIAKDSTYLRCAVYDNNETKYFVATYTIEEEGVDPTANEGKELTGVSVYPNPNTGVFYVELPVEATIDVFASNGVLVRSIAAKAGKTTLSLDHSGIYFVRIAGEGRATVKRVIVR